MSLLQKAKELKKKASDFVKNKSEFSLTSYIIFNTIKTYIGENNIEKIEITYSCKNKEVKKVLLFYTDNKVKEYKGFEIDDNKLNEYMELLKKRNINPDDEMIFIITLKSTLLVYKENNIVKQFKI